MRRRSLLTGIAGTLSLFAGCTGGSQSGSSNNTTTSPEPNPEESTTPRSSSEITEATSAPSSTETARPTTRHTETTPDTTSETANISSPTWTTQKNSECRETPSTPGTAVSEASPIALTIENTTDAQQTVETTVTPLPKSVTTRQSGEAPHEPRNLTESPVFSETTEIQAGKVKSYRCIGIDDYPRRYQLRVQAGEDLNAAYDWTQDTYGVTVNITDSSIEFSARSR